MLGWLTGKPNKKLEIEPGLYYAAFGDRLMASTIDSVLSLIVLAPFLTAFARLIGYDERELQNAMLHFVTWEQFVQDLQASGYFHRFMLQNMAQILSLGAIIIAFWFARNSTPGKMLLRMRIVDANTLGIPARRQYILRFLGYFLSALPFGLGFFWIGIDRRKQGWHDKLAGTLVVMDKRKKDALTSST